jgi:hypothetical protein
MKMGYVLKKLDLGNSVAEFDEALRTYFVETEPFRQLVQNRVDVVAGDKGTGKTAIFRILQERHRHLEEMRGIEVIAGFNPSGNPVFQRLTQEQLLTEAQYASLWKACALSLVGNWILESFGEDATASTPALDEMIPIVTTKVEFGKEPAPGSVAQIRHEGCPATIEQMSSRNECSSVGGLGQTR